MIAPYTMWLEEETSLVACGAGDGALSVLRQPPEGGCMLRYSVSGAVGAGAISTYGRVSSKPVSEHVSLSGSRWWQLGTKRFTHIEMIGADGFGEGASVQVEAVSPSGSPVTWKSHAGPYAISIRRRPRDQERIQEAGEGRSSQELYICATDEEISISPGQRFSVSEIPGVRFEVWSMLSPIASLCGEVILKREFLARRISP